MSSVERGNAFEGKMFEFIQRLVDEGELLVLSEYCTVFRQKKYPSKRRKAGVIVDLSVECVKPGEPKPFMTLFIE